MPLTTKTARQIVKFDATDRVHRNDFNLFREAGSWKYSKFQYDLEFPYESIPHMCTSKVLDYYLKNDRQIIFPKTVDIEVEVA